jgi:ubiquinone/menaquinone biosynthesis C-methylase UbiE
MEALPIGEWPTKLDESGKRNLYAERKLSQAYPDLEQLVLRKFSATLEAKPDETARFETLLTYLNRLVDLEKGSKVLVVGCGPRPEAMKVLLERGLAVVGIEPAPLFVRSAHEYLGREGLVLEGAAESIPVPDNSQHLVICDSVLEHVVSPTKSLDEMRRVLSPGGIAYITTTNRQQLSLSGKNAEFNYWFFTLLPDLVKESIVFQHLHYDPRLANYAPLPAVHWFSFSQLCSLGRQAGFSQFY